MTSPATAGPGTGDTPAEQQDTLDRLAADIASIHKDTGADAGSDCQAAPQGAVLPEGGQAALTFLIRSTSRRPLSAAEAHAKLVAREYPEDVAQAAVTGATAMRLIDDQAFAQAWVNDRGVNRGYGRQRLLRELRRRKIDDGVIEQALQALDEVDEVGQATELARARAQKMPASLEPHKVAGRLVGYLARRGYSSAVAHQVARKVTAMDRDWD
ncbi:hypothetical protein BH24ACT15_BH24ACT15_18550 [soil metagenome]